MNKKDEIQYNNEERALAFAMKRLAEGDLACRLPDGRLSSEFNLMAEAIKSKNDARMEFLANVAHDLRSPMTSVIGFLDAILDGKVEDDADREKYLRVARGECMRLSNLVQEILEVSRLESRDRKLVMEELDICELVRMVLITFEKRIDEKGLSVEACFEQDNMTAWGDAEALHRVVYNLIDNAVKYSSEGGALIIKVESDRSERGSALVSVANEGIGIKEEDLPHVFDRYYKVDRSRGSERTSTGLGLYASKLIVDAHKGSIRAESEYGKWCKLSFTIPHAAEDKA